jgi:hypothetical protein
MKIYDCITFFNEKTLFELRLNILDKFIHRFVVVEANYTHSGNPKKLNFNIKDYPKFRDKIIYIPLIKSPKNIKRPLENFKRFNSIQRIAYQRNEILKSIRSHGWSRDLSIETQTNLKTKYQIDDFKNLYTFYYPGFNLRATDLQAFLGLNQLKSLDEKNNNRYKNLLRYHDKIKNNYWKVKFSEFTSNFAYPIIHPNKNTIVKNLNEAKVECRPLVCGSMSRQPFYYEKYGKTAFEFSDIVHDYGLYLPNNPHMTEHEIDYICNIVNRSINQ